MNARALSAIIIGNEVLTAKVTEANGSLVIRRCRERGVELDAVHLIRDEVDAIVEQVIACRRKTRFLLTSGGVGPTHDDVTVRAVALALQRPVVRLPELETLVRGYYGDKPVPEAAMRMAEAPSGATLIPSEDAGFPVLECDGIFMLPGVPQLFRLHFEAVLARLPGKPVSLRQLFLDASEADIAAVLDAVALARPHVSLGSYPTWGEADHKVRITVEHESADETAATVAALTAALKPGSILRSE